jgi:hypothetical protein
MTSNENRLNHKVVYLVESYKFRIKFISIRIHTKMLQSFENRLTLTAMGHDNCSATVPNRRGPWRFAPTAMGHDGGRLVLLNFEKIVYFLQNE